MAPTKKPPYQDLVSFSVESLPDFGDDDEPANNNEPVGTADWRAVRTDTYATFGTGSVVLYLPRGRTIRTKNAKGEVVEKELGKAPLFKNWPDTVFDHTQAPAYQKELCRSIERGGNLGVKLGPDSDRLFTLDVDSDELMERWKERVPWLAKTLSTRGARGCQFWFRLESDCDYPKYGVFNVKLNGVKIAELRFGGGGHGIRSVFWGVHPKTGKRYHFLNRAPVLEVCMADLDELGYQPEQKQPPVESLTHTVKNTGGAPEADQNLVKRIMADIATWDQSVAGVHGDDMLFKKACRLVIGWGLSPEEALPYLRHYNDTKCKPPWPEDRLIYKLQEADKQTTERGALRAQSGQQRNKVQEEFAKKNNVADPDCPPSSLEEQEDKRLVELRSQFQRALVNFGEFAKLDIPPRKSLCGGWLKEGDTGFIYGQRGAGKTWTVDIIVSDLSRGTDIDEDWKADSGQIHVVLVDGEMPYDDTKARLAGLSADQNFLHLLHHEVLFERTGVVMNLTKSDQQQIVTELCEQTGAKLLVLETLSSLFRGLKEKENDDWDRINSWLLDLRRRRIAVLIVSHAGWDGDLQRGGSRREDDAMWVIRVKEVSDRPPDERGARFTTEFTKWRNVDSPPLLRQWFAKTEADGTISVSSEELSFDAQVLAKIQAGLKSPTEIAEELSVHKSRVSRASDRLAEKKLIEKHGNGNRITYEPRGFMRNEQA
jgi:AAA domain/Bifunctional DNA primase/polymerase, N-terminal